MKPDARVEPTRDGATDTCKRNAWHVAGATTRFGQNKPSGPAHRLLRRLSPRMQSTHESDVAEIRRGRACCKSEYGQSQRKQFLPLPHAPAAGEPVRKAEK